MGTPPSGGSGSGSSSTSGSSQENTGGGGMGGGSSSNSALITLLKNTTTTWSAAVVGSSTAADLELSTGTSVIAIGGWDGSDPAPSLAQFEAWVQEGKISYLIASGGQGAGGSTSTATEIINWVKAHYKSETVGGTTVYILTSATS